MVLMKWATRVLLCTSQKKIVRFMFGYNLATRLLKKESRVIIDQTCYGEA